MVRDGIRVTDRMLKYIRVPENGPTKERVSLLLEEAVILLADKGLALRREIDGAGLLKYIVINHY